MAPDPALVLAALALAAGLVLFLAFVAVVRRVRRRRAVDAPAGPRPHVDTDADGALCTACGTVNDADFEFCRNCGWRLDD